MAKKDVERLIGRAVLDPSFRQSLFADPEKAIQEAGLKLSEKELASLKEIDREKAKVAVEGMARLSRQAWK